MEDNEEETEEETKDFKLVFGTLCFDINKRKDLYESFLFDPSNEQMQLIELRATMNSHRDYRFFSFLCTKENYDDLKIFSEQNEDGFIEWIKTSGSVTISKTILKC